MDPKQFDALSRTLAVGTSRRQAVARFGAAGLLAGLAGAFGRGHEVKAIPAVQADTCRLAIVANVRLGPSAGVIIQGSVPGELRGELSFAIGPDGAIDSGRLRLEGGAELPVVGQANGRAVNLRVDVAPDQTFILVGTAQQRLDQCTGDVDGLLTGPRVGDLGDWHATATPLGSGGEGQAGAPAAPSPVPGAPAAPSPALGAPAATATPPAGAPPSTPTPVPGATATPSPTATSTPAPTETPTPAPTETPTPLPTTACSLGLSSCNGVCVDQLIDPAHCGDCGNACQGGEPCFGGVCQSLPLSPVCPTGAICGGVCVDQLIDPANCGGCGNVCTPSCGAGAGECNVFCDAGVCYVSLICHNPMLFCYENGNCVDPQTDPANCGGCGLACGVIETCLNGVCQPAPVSP